MQRQTEPSQAKEEDHALCAHARTVQHQSATQRSRAGSWGAPAAAGSAASASVSMGSSTSTSAGGKCSCTVRMAVTLASWRFSGIVRQSMAGYLLPAHALLHQR